MKLWIISTIFGIIGIVLLLVGATQDSRPVVTGLYGGNSNTNIVNSFPLFSTLGAVCLIITFIISIYALFKSDEE